MRRVLVSSLGALMLVPATAAAAPADVTVRVEGVSDTLVAGTTVRTTTAPVNKSGVAGQDCTGTSAAGALELATQGSWGGAYNAGFSSYQVETIRGETHAFPDPDYFTFWVNGRPASAGICGVELQQGDDVLFFVDRCEFNGSACVNPPVLPLALEAPARVAPGAPFTVKVVQLTGTGTTNPVAGAAVGGSVTDAAGAATLTLPAAGPVSLRATKAGSARSATTTVCATTGSDGACGSSLATRPGTPTTQPDRSAPAVTIKGIREGQRFARGKGPRSLRVSLAPDPSGILAVKFRLTRTDGPRCTYFSGRKERQVRSKCGANKRFAWFGVGDRQDTSYLLPGRLPRGRYVFDVNVIDKAYNRDDKRRRGGNRIVFVVR